MISSSPGELEPVFNAMLASATASARPNLAFLFPKEMRLRCVAMHNAPAAFAEERRRHPVFHLPWEVGTSTRRQKNRWRNSQT